MRRYARSEFRSYSVSTPKDAASRAQYGVLPTRAAAVCGAIYSTYFREVTPTYGLLLVTMLTLHGTIAHFSHENKWTTRCKLRLRSTRCCVLRTHDVLIPSFQTVARGHAHPCPSALGIPEATSSPLPKLRNAQGIHHLSLIQSLPNPRLPVSARTKKDIGFSLIAHSPLKSETTR